MSRYGVSLKKEEALDARMRELGLGEEDLVEKFIRSSGPGGQRVNKVSTCVYLKHIPSGLSVKCGEERSLALNRFLARRRLIARIEEIRLGRLSEERQLREKVRRQKRRRSRRAKAKMLDSKHLQGEKKRLRAPVGGEN